MSRETGSGLSQAEHSLVASGFLGPGEIDEAIARQLIFGGDLSTSVLEIAPVAEDQLESILARAAHLPASGSRPWRVDSKVSVELYDAGVPALALEKEAGIETRHLLVTGPLSESHQEAATAILGSRPELRLCLEVRYLEAAAVALAQPLEPRLLRLLGRLGRGSIDTMGPRFDPRTRPLESLPSTLEDAPPGRRPGTTAAPPIDYDDVARKAASTAKIADSDPDSNHKAQSRALAFRAALGTARTRDSLVLAALGLCLEAFPFAACFAIQRGELRGLLAQARHEPSQDIHHIGIPLDLRSAFSRAVQEAASTVFRPQVLGLEGGVLEDLRRPPGHDVALVPILVRKRPVLLLWLDLAPKMPIVPDSIRLNSLVEPISQGLERLMLEKRQLSRLASLAPRRSSVPPAPPGPSEAPPPPSFAPAALLEPGQPSEEAIPESPIDPPPPARRFIASAMPAAIEGSLDQMLRASIESAPPPQAFGPRARTSRPPSERDSDPSSPGTLKGFPKGTTKIAFSEPPPRFPESPQPFAAAGFAPLKPRRSVRVDTRASLTPDRTISLGPALPPDSPPVPTEPIATIPGVSPLAPPIGLPYSVAPAETIPGLSPDDSPRLSARTMVSSAPLFGFGSSFDESPADEGDAAPLIPSLRPSQLPPPDEYTAWIADLEAGDESVLDRYVDGGEAAVAALMTIFPGRVSEPRTSATRASECGTVPRILVHLGRRSVPFLTIRSRDEDPVVRRWATFTLGEIPCKDAAEVIATRLFDRMPDVRRAALASARRMNVDPLARRALRAAVEAAAEDVSLDGDARAGAIEALVDIREYESIPTMLMLLDDRDKSVKRTAKWALTVLMRQDFGSDAAAWRSFWNEHRDEDRIEWLILALDHISADLRRAAGDELAGLTGQRFNFDPHSNPTERRLSQARYREWWSARGQSPL